VNLLFIFSCDKKCRIKKNDKQEEYLVGVLFVAKRIGELLHNFVQKDNNWKIKLFENWDFLVGPLKDKVSIEKIDRNLLILGVSHPAWAQELFMLSDMLRQKINSFLGKEYIKTIRFRFIEKNRDSNNFDDKTKQDDKLDDKETLKKLYLTERERKNLSKVTDPELKDWLEKFCLCCKRGRNEKRRKNGKKY